MKTDAKRPVKVHPMRSGRRVPIRSLMRRLAVAEYAHPAPLLASPASPRRVLLPLRQGAGVANQPIVQPGERVRAGQALGGIPAGSLGAIIHAPFDAIVAAVGGGGIALERAE
jgi:Na+-translocating ferredoxin:NAD+ oxidoreductase RnfC subunit